MSMEVRDIIIYIKLCQSESGGQANASICNMITCYMIVHIHMLMYIFYKKWCNLDAIIYNKITSIVNVIKLKLFTLKALCTSMATEIMYVYYIYNKNHFF